jgi:nucleotide-binding universal stress UspA family protein
MEMLMFKHLLVPVDGSELSQAALQQACSFAREAGARLTVYHAKPSYLPYGMATEGAFDLAGASEAYRTAMDKRDETILNRAKQAATEAGLAIDAISAECDEPYAGIVATAQSCSCDLIFMASHGRRGASALLLGSITQKVLTHCRIPVLVYR